MKLNDFVFVTCLTPSASLSPLRAELFELYKLSLKKQSSNNWTAVLMGEESKQEANFLYIKSNTVTKEDKLLELYNLFLKLEHKPKYIIRLDDDDLFSLSILSKIEMEISDFDVYVDRYQCMYNVFDTKSLCKEYPWFPSTLVMKFEDAMQTIESFNNLPLFVCDHDKVFHHYYKNKKVYYSHKGEPIYLRVFSPTSLSFADSKNKFERYCNSFGVWKFVSFKGFEWAAPKLEQLNAKYFNSPKPNKFLFNLTADLFSILKRIKGKIIK